MSSQPTFPFMKANMPLGRSAKKDKERERLLELWDWKCVYQCGTVLSIGTMTFDHLIPRARGGRSYTKKDGKKKKNLVPACGPCNMTKGSFYSVEELDDFYKRTKRILEIAEKIQLGEITPP